MSKNSKISENIVMSPKSEKVFTNIETGQNSEGVITNIETGQKKKEKWSRKSRWASKIQTKDRDQDMNSCRIELKDQKKWSKGYSKNS